MSSSGAFQQFPKFPKTNEKEEKKKKAFHIFSNSISFYIFFCYCIHLSSLKKKKKNSFLAICWLFRLVRIKSISIYLSLGHACVCTLFRTYSVIHTCNQIYLLIQNHSIYLLLSSSVFASASTLKLDWHNGRNRE